MRLIAERERLARPGTGVIQPDGAFQFLGCLTFRARDTRERGTSELVMSGAGPEVLSADLHQVICVVALAGIVGRGDRLPGRVRVTQPGCYPGMFW
jgi:hypothetical protein